MNKKDRLLGESQGSAVHRLRRMLLFEFARRLDLLVCFRCRQPIENLDEFSTEHKESWERAQNPRQVFFDINNVVFSHLKCNCGAYNRDKTHCSKGHPLVWVESRQSRQCVECRRTWRNNYMKTYRKVHGR